MSDERSDVKAALEAAMDQSSSPMLKLDIDCLEELFEWLSIADLLALRPTCKRLKRAADYFIRENYPAIRIGFGRAILTSYQDKINQFRSRDDASKKMVKELTLWSQCLRAEEIDAIKGIFNQLERFQIGAYRIKGGFYESILKFCNNLSYLSIHHICGNRIADKSQKWLCRQYPTINHIELNDNGPGGPGDGGRVVELKNFFELNPNIQTFTTTFNFFCENRECWLGSNIRLDLLIVEGDCFYQNGMHEICNFFNELYDQGFYKRIHMHTYYFQAQNELDNIASVKGLEKLYLSSVIVPELTLPPMPNLRELCFSWHGDFDKVANRDCFVNVERVLFKDATSNQIMEVLRYAVKVKEIKAIALKEGAHLNDNILDVEALNNARKQLAGARRTTVYVPEDIFLTTKWAMINTRFDLIEIKRGDAVDWTK